ncbi:site-specific DNA-methyltransferase [candidate division KSB1 bacterium]|nr:site-specific DNA-methyltransferase [candidate division KSB1 bacterium]
MKQTNEKHAKQKGPLPYATKRNKISSRIREQASAYLSSPKISRKKTPPKDVIKNVEKARTLVLAWLDKNGLRDAVHLGLPEIDDRKNVWRVGLKYPRSSNGNGLVGEVILDAASGDLCQHTEIAIIKSRLLKLAHETDENGVVAGNYEKTKRQSPPPFLPNKIVLGDAAQVLSELPLNSVQLVFTSPPYFNARPEYTEYLDYQEYLDSLRRVFLRCHEVMSEGRFLVVNTSPILVRRISRQTASRRLALPFDLHHVLSNIGFDFVDDIIWVKPEGAGWATGRGRRFAADRHPLQYKAVPVTEYVMVYRKQTEKLIDWNIRTHHDAEAVQRSKIEGKYDVTNIWRITPAHHKDHPAIFPEELVEKVIRYYSFVGDLVLDPFAGSGTVGRVALKMSRRFFLIENEAKYFHNMLKELATVAKTMRQEVLCEPEEALEPNEAGQRELF